MLLSIASFSSKHSWTVSRVPHGEEVGVSGQALGDQGVLPQ